MSRRTIGALGLTAAIAAAVAAIALPGLLAARGQRSEGAELGLLARIPSAQELFRARDLDGDGVEDYAASLDELTRAGLIDGPLASGVASGYRFTLERPAPLSYVARAEPTAALRRRYSDTRFLYVDETGRVRHERDRPAGPESPVYGPIPGTGARERREEITMEEREKGSDGPLFFESPERAVPEIALLLEREEWRTLARYYDLSGSKVDRADLESGAFFVRAERPEAAHPAGFWRYKQPFAPGYRYAGHTVGEDGVAAVEVRVEIDQGDGRVQTGLGEFKMRRSGRGWQVLPAE